MRLHKKRLLILFNLAFVLYIFISYWKSQLSKNLNLNILDERIEIFSTKFEEDAKKLYLNDKYLKLIHLAYENIDSKSVVDRATKKSLDEVLNALENLDENNLDSIRLFVDEYLHEPGYEIVKANLTDWKHFPKYIDSIKNDNLKQFSLALNEIWKDLYKRLDTKKLSIGAVSSHLPLKNPFIVPGGRFIGKN